MYTVTKERNSNNDILQNIDPQREITKGTRLIVNEIHRNLINCTIVTGCKKGIKVTIPRISTALGEIQFLFVLNRKQFSLVLAFSMPLHKTQGRSII